MTELGDSSNGSVVLYDEVYYQVVADDFDPLSVASKVLPSLNPNGGKLNISTISNKEAVEKIQMAFMLAGLKVQSESVHGENRVFTAEYRRHNSKSVSIGLLKLEEKKTDTVQINMEENNDDIIDEDDLLDAGVIATPPAVDMDAIKDANDCGGRKACDNCTCGRAEQEATTAKEAQVPTSSCGNCAKGDAVSVLNSDMQLFQSRHLF